MKKQAGFTLIELVIVIVILGILAAFALPRFADLSSDAREASIKGAAGSIKAAAAIAHSKWLVDGDTDSIEISLEGVSIAMANGYPTAASIIVAAQLDVTTNGDYDTTPDPVSDSDSSVDISIPAYANCKVTYTPAANAGDAATTTFDDTSFDCSN